MSASAVKSAFPKPLVTLTQPIPGLPFEPLILEQFDVPYGEGRDDQKQAITAAFNNVRDRETFRLAVKYVQCLEEFAPEGKLDVSRLVFWEWLRGVTARMVIMPDFSTVTVSYPKLD